MMGFYLGEIFKFEFCIFKWFCDKVFWLIGSYRIFCFTCDCGFEGKEFGFTWKSDNFTVILTKIFLPDRAYSISPKDDKIPAP